MPKKRKNNGKNRHNRGRVKSIRCDISGRLVPKDKAIKRYRIENMIDPSTQRDIIDAQYYDRYRIPRFYHKSNYCISQAMFQKIVRSRSKHKRHQRKPVQLSLDRSYRNEWSGRREHYININQMKNVQVTPKIRHRRQYGASRKKWEVYRIMEEDNYYWNYYYYDHDDIQSIKHESIKQESIKQDDTQSVKPETMNKQLVNEDDTDRNYIIIKTKPLQKKKIVYVEENVCDKISVDDLTRLIRICGMVFLQYLSALSINNLMETNLFKMDGILRQSRFVLYLQDLQYRLKEMIRKCAKQERNGRSDGRWKNIYGLWRCSPRLYAISLAKYRAIDFRIYELNHESNKEYIDKYINGKMFDSYNLLKNHKYRLLISILMEKQCELDLGGKRKSKFKNIKQTIKPYILDNIKDIDILFRNKKYSFCYLNNAIKTVSTHHRFDNYRSGQVRKIYFDHNGVFFVFKQRYLLYGICYCVATIDAWYWLDNCSYFTPSLKQLFLNRLMDIKQIIIFKCRGFKSFTTAFAFCYDNSILSFSSFY